MRMTIMGWFDGSPAAKIYFTLFLERDETRSNNSHNELATPKGNSQLGSNCQNSKAPANSFNVVVPRRWCA